MCSTRSAETARSVALDTADRPVALALAEIGETPSALVTDALGNVTEIVESAPGSVTRSFTYRDYQYFLTGAAGPSGWQSTSWSYDRIGNRLDDSSLAYMTYLQNTATSGNTAVLDDIHIGFADVRDYSFDAAGRLQRIKSSAGQWQNNFSFDDENRLTRMAKKRDTDAIALQYDGRGFLALGVREADGLEMRPLYSSEGVYMGVRRTPTAGFEEFEAVFYFAGRPVAQWRKVDMSPSTITWLTTDHLGTPILATNTSGAAIWSGGFEPFGQDYANAHNAQIRVRLPGQIEDPLWRDSTLETSLYYNVHRWYESGTGRYTRPDRLGRRGDLHPYAYVRSNPLTGKDPFGLFRIKGPAPGCAIEYIQNQIPKLVDHPTIPANLATASGCSLAEVQEGLRWGSGPEVEFDDLAPGDAGEFDPNIPDRFRIDRPAAEGVCGSCACPDALLGLGISILHEYAHQLHQKCRGLETGPDIGDRFENVSYGPGGSLGPSQAFLYGCP